MIGLPACPYSVTLFAHASLSGRAATLSINARGADLTFATTVPRVRERMSNPKAPLATYICKWSFDSNIRSGRCQNGRRMFESDHWFVYSAAAGRYGLHDDNHGDN